MPGPYGVTPTGYNPKSFEEIFSDLQSAWRTVFGNGIDVSADSPDGNILGIFADRLADLWQANQAVYNVAFPDTATGIGLDRVMGITGTVRQQATKSTVDVTITGVAGTVIPAGSRVSVDEAGTLFELVGGSVNIGGGGTVSATLTAVEFGPMHAPAGTLTEIETPVAGWTSVTNPADQSSLGRLADNDPAARVNREASLRAIGSSAPDAIRAALLQLAGVTSVAVFQNETDFIVSGAPPRSMECVVDGGTDAEIAQTIWDRKPAGTPTYGNTTTSATDSKLVSHAINYSRPADVDVWIIINVQANANAAANVDDLIAQAVADWGDLNLDPGAFLVAQALVPTVFSFEGIVDVEPPLIGLADPPTLSATLPATARQQLALDTSRIVVNVTRI